MKKRRFFTDSTTFDIIYLLDGNTKSSRRRKDSSKKEKEKIWSSADSWTEGNIMKFDTKYYSYTDRMAGYIYLSVLFCIAGVMVYKLIEIFWNKAKFLYSPVNSIIAVNF